MSLKIIPFIWLLLPIPVLVQYLNDASPPFFANSTQGTPEALGSPKIDEDDRSGVLAPHIHLTRGNWVEVRTT
jgi:hypothetical protein